MTNGLGSPGAVSHFFSSWNGPKVVTEWKCERDANVPQVISLLPQGRVCKVALIVACANNLCPVFCKERRLAFLGRDLG